MATTKNAEYKVYNGTDYDPIHFKTDASLVNIADAGAKITATDVEGALQEVATNIATANTNISTANTNIGLKANQVDMNDSMYCSVYKLSLDANGIYVEVDYKRKDGTMIVKSVLSGGTSPKYTTRTETKYAQNGTTVEWTKIYTLSYDANDNISSEVLN